MLLIPTKLVLLEALWDLNSIGNNLWIARKPNLSNLMFFLKLYSHIEDDAMKYKYAIEFRNLSISFIYEGISHISDTKPLRTIISFATKKLNDYLLKVI